MDEYRKRRRTFRKTYSLPDGSISVLFPKFISELRAVSEDQGTDSVVELISRLQGICLAEGIKPDWSRWEDHEVKQERLRIERLERASRLADARARKREERRRLGADFPDRVKKVRNRLADF